MPARGEKRLDALAAVLMAASEIALATEKGSDAEAEAETADDAFALMTDEQVPRRRRRAAGQPEIWTRRDARRRRGVRGNRARSKRTCSRCRRSQIRGQPREAAPARARRAGRGATWTADARRQPCSRGDGAGRGGAGRGSPRNVNDEEAREGSDEGVPPGETKDLSSRRRARRGCLSKDVCRRGAAAATGASARTAARRRGRAGRSTRVRRDGRLSRRGGVETNAASRAPIAAPTFAVARSFTGRTGPRLRADHVVPPDDVDAVTGVGLFDVQYGREPGAHLVDAGSGARRGARRRDDRRVALRRRRRPPPARRRSSNAYAWCSSARGGGAGAGCGGVCATSTATPWTTTPRRSTTANAARKSRSRRPGSTVRELAGSARAETADALAILYGYFVDEGGRDRQRTPMFLSAGWSGPTQTQAKQPETNRLAGGRRSKTARARALAGCATAETRRRSRQRATIRPRARARASCRRKLRRV